MLASGALTTEDPRERRSKGYRTNPDGDVDVPNTNYDSFRYPACPVCTAHPPVLADGTRARIELDRDGAWLEGSNAGILKPSVIMFGESIPGAVKTRAENMIDSASRLLVVGSSLATYSAWRLVKRAKEASLPIGILNMGGVRGEEAFFSDVAPEDEGRLAVRVSEAADVVLPQVVKVLKELDGFEERRTSAASTATSL
jgi:NAD-dependent deacetylase sirtuin 4